MELKLKIEARRRPPPARQASSAKSWARQLPECQPRKLALCSSPDRHLSYHLSYLVPQPCIIVACLSCGQKKTEAATLKATGALSCVLSAGMSVPEEEVAPLDARQQVLGATGWYDRVSGWLCSCRSCRTAFSMPDFQDELSQAWKWQCLVHEASRMVFLSAGETALKVNIQSHSITRATTSNKTGIVVDALPAKSNIQVSLQRGR